MTTTKSTEQHAKLVAAVRKIELSGGARRALRDSLKSGWVPSHVDKIDEAELVRAGLVYDGAVTGDGDLYFP
jgi:hypothetical protein